MQVDYQQAKLHLELLTGEADPLVSFQVIYDPKEGPRRPDLAATFDARLSECHEYFDAIQSHHCGIYVTVNRTDGNGREEHNIIGYRAVFADFDGTVEPDWPLPPHFTTRRDETHGHAYWLLGAEIDSTTFRSLQRRIAMCCGTDKQVTDPCRVLRLCGTGHYKDPANPKVYSVHTVNTLTGKYVPEHFVAHFNIGASGEAELARWLESREGLSTGAGYTNEQRYINQFRRWCEVQAGVAVEGNEGSLTLIRTASWAHDHGIDVATATPILWELYNPRCLPPWGEHEKRDFDRVVERAYKYAMSAPGCRTTSALFQALGPVPEPVGGWEANRAQRPVEQEQVRTVTPDQAMGTVAGNNRMSRLAARDSLSCANNKTEHYTLAKIFDGMLFNGCEVYRWGKVFYTFNGKHWEQTPDELIKAKITAFYDTFFPSSKFVNGVFDMFSNLVTIVEQENNSWFNQPDRDSSGTITFTNGLVDVVGNNIDLLDHTSQYFSLNMVDYAFDELATCPRWLAFLNELWDGDQELINQLQEYMGYCLTQDVSRQKFALFIGKSRGGKGVIVDVITRMIGEARVAAPSLDTLGDNVSKNTMSRSQLTLIPDAHNVPFQRRDSVLSILKAITGCDRLTYDVKYKDSRSHVFLTHIILTTNNMPEFIDASGALVNRMLAFPFWKSWVGRENVNLRDELFTELPGIVTWAIAGLKRLTANNRFTESAASLREKDDMREDMFRLHPFIAEYCTVDGDKGSFTSNDELYFAYACWAAGETNTKAISKNAFVNELRSSPLPVTAERRLVQHVRKRGFAGIRITKQLPASNVTKFPAVDNRSEVG